MLRNNNSPSVLGETPIFQLLLQYSIPAIIAMTATSLYNIVDSIFIGQGVGTSAIAGLAITFPLMNLLFAFCFLISAGGTTLSSIFLGQKDDTKATETLHNVTLLCFVHGIIFGTITLIYLKPILYFFGATESTMNYAYDFMEIIVIATPMTFVYFGLNNIMRATGYPKKAMYSALLSVMTNVILAPLFIFVFEWGIKGAAWATIISQMISMLWVATHFFKKDSYIRFKRGSKWFDKHLTLRMYGIGLSPFIINVCSCIVVILINKLLLEYGGDDGDLGVGAYGIINRVSMLSVMIVLGISQGMQPILGFNYGAAKWNRVKKTLKYGMIAGITITSIGWVFCEFTPGIISVLFTTDTKLIEITNRGFLLSFIFWPTVGLQLIIQNFFQSIGNPKISIILSASRQIIILVPLLLLFSHIWGTDGVWFSLSVSDGLACIMAVLILSMQIKKFNRQFHEQQLNITTE